MIRNAQLTLPIDAKLGDTFRVEGEVVVVETKKSIEGRKGYTVDVYLRFGEKIEKKRRRA